MPWLKMLKGETPGRAFPLDQETTVLGRDAACEIVLSDHSVSRRHAEITRKDDGFYIEDLLSTNGTKVANQELTEPRRLDDGDPMEIGDTQFVFSETGSTILGVLDVSSTSERQIVMVRPEEKLHAILEIARDLGGTIDLDGVLGKVLETLFRILPQAERGFILLKADLWPQLFSDVNCIALWISSEKILTRLYSVLHWFHKRLEANVKNPRENRCFQTVIVFSFGSFYNSNKCAVLLKIAARLITVSTSVNKEMWVKLRPERGSFLDSLCGRLRDRGGPRRRRPADHGGLAQADEQVRLDGPPREDARGPVPSGRRGRLRTRGPELHWPPDIRLLGLHPLLGTKPTRRMGGQAQDGEGPTQASA